MYRCKYVYLHTKILRRFVLSAFAFHVYKGGRSDLCQPPTNTETAPNQLDMTSNFDLPSLTHAQG